MTDATRESFNRVATDDALSVTSTGEFNLARLRPERGIPNFKASPEAVAALAEKTNELLSQAGAENPNPMGVVAMPGERMVVVVQLVDVSLRDPESGLYHERLEFSERPAYFETEKLADPYFTFGVVVKRLDYKPQDKSSGS
jgi:hypothetical protein